MFHEGSRVPSAFVLLNDNRFLKTCQKLCIATRKTFSLRFTRPDVVHGAYTLCICRLLHEHTFAEFMVRGLDIITREHTKQYKRYSHTPTGCAVHTENSQWTYMDPLLPQRITSSILQKLKRKNERKIKRRQSLARHHRATRVSQNNSRGRDLERTRCEEEQSGIRLRGQQPGGRGGGRAWRWRTQSASVMRGLSLTIPAVMTAARKLHALCY